MQNWVWNSVPWTQALNVMWDTMGCPALLSSAGPEGHRSSVRLMPCLHLPWPHSIWHGNRHLFRQLNPCDFCANVLICRVSPDLYEPLHTQMMGQNFAWHNCKPIRRPLQFSSQRHLSQSKEVRLIANPNISEFRKTNQKNVTSSCLLELTSVNILSPQ